MRLTWVQPDCWLAKQYQQPSITLWPASAHPRQRPARNSPAKRIDNLQMICPNLAMGDSKDFGFFQPRPDPRAVKVVTVTFGHPVEMDAAFFIGISNGLISILL